MPGHIPVTRQHHDGDGRARYDLLSSSRVVRLDHTLRAGPRASYPQADHLSVWLLLATGVVLGGLWLVVLFALFQVGRLVLDFLRHALGGT